MIFSKFKAALIGCGKIGSEFADDPRVDGVATHAGAYKACESTELVAVCDNDAAKAERCADRWKVGASFSDAREMLKAARPDIVSICTPDSTHAELLQTVLTTPGVKAVLAEKPLATDVKRAEQLVALALDKGITLAVNYSRRFAQGHVGIKKKLSDGIIGRIRHVTGYYTKGTLHNGTHWFDLARWLVGEVSEVRGMDQLRESTPDPTLSAWLKFETGAEGYLHGCDASLFTVFEMDLVGERGRIRLVDSGHALEIYEVQDSPHYTGYRNLMLKEVLAGGFHDVALHAVRDVVRCLKEGGAPLCSGTDAVQALRIADAVRASAASGAAVAMAR